MLGTKLVPPRWLYFYFHKITSLRRNPCLWKLWSPGLITAFSFVPRNWIEKSGELRAFLRIHRHSDTSVQHNWQNIYHGTPQFLYPRKGRQGTEKGKYQLQITWMSREDPHTSPPLSLRLLHPQFKSTGRLRAGGTFSILKACSPVSNTDLFL